jgi:hypothetical protein
MTRNVLKYLHKFPLKVMKQSILTPNYMLKDHLYNVNLLYVTLQKQ